MSNEAKAKEVSKILRYLATKFDKNPDLIENFKIEIKYIDMEKSANGNINPFNYDNEEELARALSHESVDSLKLIIKKNMLDRKHETAKINSKKLLIAFIQKGIATKLHRGESFFQQKN
ncbi:MAG: hypothetical protein QXZ44_07245 [Ferroplasma sp.]